MVLKAALAYFMSQQSSQYQYLLLPMTIFQKRKGNPSYPGKEHTENLVTVTGVGGTKISTIGSFTRNVTVNDEEFTLTFHIIPANATNFKSIIGNPLLNKAEVSIRENGIFVFKKEENNFLMELTLDEEIKIQPELKLEHIENTDFREAIEELVQDYKPEKTKAADIEMKIVMRSEEPIYQRPRRLSTTEKAEVEKQIKEWLDEGIIRDSSSDFASPIVLVRKDGRIRICYDYRKINQNIVKDRLLLLFLLT